MSKWSVVIRVVAIPIRPLLSAVGVVPVYHFGIFMAILSGSIQAILGRGLIRWLGVEKLSALCMACDDGDFVGIVEG